MIEELIIGKYTAFMRNNWWKYNVYNLDKNLQIVNIVKHL